MQPIHAKQAISAAANPALPHAPLGRAVLFAATFAATLGGCSSLPELGPYGPGDITSDGTRCSGSVTAGPVYIDVRYAADGTPIDPGDCTVVAGTRVTWRGPDGEPVTFVIQFKQAAPISGDERGWLPSVQDGRRHKVVRTIDAAPGRYNYGIKANDKELDPAIIIRPN